MNFKNKFDETTSKYYIIETNTGEYMFTHKGSKNDFFMTYDDMPCIAYVTKVRATLLHNIKTANSWIEHYKDEKNNILGHSEELTRHYEGRIIQYKTALYKLKHRNAYEIIGIFEVVADIKGSPEECYKYTIVDYKHFSEIYEKIGESRFIEISKTKYDELEAESRKKLAEYRARQSQSSTDKKENADTKVEKEIFKYKELSILDTAKLLAGPLIVLTCVAILFCKFISWAVTTFPPQLF